jgi:hypothetical protein
MATKPSDTGRFAVDGSDVDATHISAPSSSQRDLGWSLNEVPTSDVENYLQNNHYRWKKYLSDGAFSGASTFDSTVGITGALTAGSVNSAGALAVGGQHITIVTFVFTADNTTEIFTATGHGLSNGDGPIQVASSGTLPTGLSPATNYWVIVLTANTFHLATSQSQALAGNFLAISSNGTGTHTLSSTGSTVRLADASVTRSFFALGPSSFNDALTIGGTLTVVGAALVLNGSTALRHGVRTKIISPKMSGGYIPSSGFGLSVEEAIVGGSGSPPIASGIQCSLDEYFIFGDRITDIRWKVTDSASGPTTASFALREQTVSTGATSTLATSGTSAGSGATQTLIVSSSPLFTVQTDKFHFLLGSVSGGNNVSFLPFEVDYDHPV